MKRFLTKIKKSILRNPYSIVLIISAIGCVVYTLDLYVHSAVVSRMTSPSMGFFTFLITLLAFLSPITYLFYMDKKKWLMFGLFEAMSLGLIALGIFYLARIQFELNQGMLPMDDNIFKSWNNVTVSIIFWSISPIAAVGAIIFDRWWKKRKLLGKNYEKK